MALKQNIQQVQTQRLVLSPQIRQFLHLLQLPYLEIHEAINQELATNPAVEELPKDDIEVMPIPGSEQISNDPNHAELSPEEQDFQRKLDDLQKLDDVYNPSSFGRKDPGHERIEDLEQKQNYRESLITKPTSLADHLLWQTRLLKLNDTEEEIAEYIIGNIDDDGYLTVTLEEISAEKKIPLSETEHILTLIQQLEPSGVGARSLGECLLIQLKRMDHDTRLAQRMITERLSFLEKRKYLQIARSLHVSEGLVRDAAKLISRLEPKPGRIFYREEPVTVVPDIRVFKDEVTGQFHIEMLDETFPRLRISPQYRKMLRDKSLDQKTREYLRERIHSGLWFMNALEQRKSTLQKIAAAIVDIQSEYLEHGPACLKPLRMKDIAGRVGIHESTVSRAIQGKYMRVPFGTVSMKSLFSTSLATEDGGAESQTSIMEKLKKLVESEDHEKPLSDQKLVMLLKQQGAKVARRTVAKYRDMLRILPSHSRRGENAS